MKSIIAALIVFPAIAVAAPEPLQPAPVPTIDDGHVTPADRAGEFNGDVVGVPFSAAPNNEIAGRGQAGPLNEEGTTRQTAPSPNVTK